MAKQTSVNDPYLDYIKAEKKKIEDDIKSRNKIQYERIADLDNKLRHYQSFKKSLEGGKSE